MRYIVTYSTSMVTATSVNYVECLIPEYIIHAYVYLCTCITFSSWDQVIETTISFLCSIQVQRVPCFWSDPVPYTPAGSLEET